MKHSILNRIETNPILDNNYIKLSFNPNINTKDLIFISSVRLINQKGSLVEFDNRFHDKWITTPLKVCKHHFSVKFKEEIKEGFKLFISVKCGHLGRNESHVLYYNGTMWINSAASNTKEVT